LAPGSEKPIMEERRFGGEVEEWIQRRNARRTLASHSGLSSRDAY
jgi:hypothetical protein